MDPSPLRRPGAKTGRLRLCKPFDGNKTDADPDNYYMEREWRVLGNVMFTLPDVYRVVIPSAFAKRLREEVPNYYGQITFVD